MAHKEKYSTHNQPNEEDVCLMSMALMECNTIAHNRLVDIVHEAGETHADEEKQTKLASEISDTISHEIVLSMMTHNRKLKNLVESKNIDTSSGATVVDLSTADKSLVKDLHTLMHEALNDFVLAGLMGYIEAVGKHAQISKELAYAYGEFVETRMQNIPGDDLADIYLESLETNLETLKGEINDIPRT